jgi:hypothetical protein
MNATTINAIVDRVALSFINTLVLVGLPLVAVSMVVQSL